jgi:hypothetical protein
MAPHQQRAAEQQAFAVCAFVHCHGFTGEQGFVHLNVTAREQHRVCGYAVAFGQHQHIATHHVLPGYALGLPVAHHQGTRAAQVAQRFQRALGLAFLIQREGQHHQHQAQQNQPLLQVAQQQVQSRSGQQQREHRLTQRFPGDGMPSARLFTGQGVGAVGLQSLCSFG